MTLSPQDARIAGWSSTRQYRKPSKIYSHNWCRPCQFYYKMLQLFLLRVDGSARWVCWPTNGRIKHDMTWFVDGCPRIGNWKVNRNWSTWQPWVRPQWRRWKSISFNEMPICRSCEVSAQSPLFDFPVLAGMPHAFGGCLLYFRWHVQKPGFWA